MLTFNNHFKFYFPTEVDSNMTVVAATSHETKNSPIDQNWGIRNQNKLYTWEMRNVVDM